MEAEHWCTLLLLLVQFVGADLPLSHWQWLRLISGQVLGDRLDIKEDRLLCHTIVILSMDDELTSVLNLVKNFNMNVYLHLNQTSFLINMDLGVMANRIMFGILNKYESKRSFIFNQR